LCPRDDERNLVCVQAEDATAESPEPHPDHDPTRVCPDLIDEADSTSGAVDAITLAVGKPGRRRARDRP